MHKGCIKNWSIVSQQKLDNILDRNVKWVGVILYRFMKGKESTF